MEITKHTTDQLVVRESSNIIKVFGGGIIVLAMISFLCMLWMGSELSYSKITIGAYSFCIILGIYLLVKWHYRLTCIFDKTNGQLTCKYLAMVFVKTERYSLNEIQRVEVIFSGGFKKEPLRQLVLTLKSGEQLPLQNSQLTVPINLGATAILINQFLGLANEKQDLVLASFGRCIDKPPHNPA